MSLNSIIKLKTDYFPESWVLVPKLSTKKAFFDLLYSNQEWFEYHFQKNLLLLVSVYFLPVKAGSLYSIYEKMYMHKNKKIIICKFNHANLAKNVNLGT